ncbi:MAG TPA: nuclease-related domain-containing protein [Aggregatilinea sp.]|uniref:nuclease-related domain-containing protein n=1 Tax=Aggregatilinea sp. TaxID=2806333 RepID=UPI002C9538F1|nr:nuclease-related domain-containing protein [Aggregatilinea sp.]HML20206.1 nuclease-related domain-containing protein [Aggregatilinea sp.]
MRVVTNEALLKRNRTISHVLFFASLGGMALGFFYTWSNPASSSASSLSCLLLPTLLLMTVTSVRMANQWIREPRPAQALQEALKGLGSRYTLFNYLLPAHHVLIGPEGVFMIHTVWQEKEYHVSGKKWSGDGGMLNRVMGYMRQDLIGNPFREAEFEAQQIQRVIDKLAPDSGVTVQPVVVFISVKARFEAEDPDIPVVYGDPKKKPSLRQFIKEQRSANRATLSEEAMDRIDQAYGLVTRQELTGMDLEEVEDEDVAETAAPIDDTPVEADADFDARFVPAEPDTEMGGMIVLVQSGQLVNIDAVPLDGLDAHLDALEDEITQSASVLRTIQADDPEALETYLYKKFVRQRQKGDWYGLRKKDLAWLMSIGDQLQKA